jgi:hypothetical protein
MFNSNYSSNLPSYFGARSNTFQIIQMAVVEKVGITPINTSDEAINKRNKRMNVDPYIIKCRIIGSEFDNKLTTNELPNCFPLLPKFNGTIPKENEIVLIFMLNEDDKYGDRFYIGPIISSNIRLKKDTIYNGATSGLSIGPLDTLEDLSKIPEIKGVYPEYDSDFTNVINGRDNTDITFKRNEIILRAGKFEQNNPKAFNEKNPAYIQIKHGFNYKKKSSNSSFANGVNNYTFGEPISVNNIVANKINLLTYDNGHNSSTDNIFNLTARDKTNNTTPYITDDELNNILETAHPLVFGDILIDYLKLLKKAFMSHNHNNLGIGPPIQANPDVSDFIKKAAALEERMLSKNIKIN